MGTFRFSTSLLVVASVATLGVVLHAAGESQSSSPSPVVETGCVTSLVSSLGSHGSQDTFAHSTQYLLRPSCGPALAEARRSATNLCGADGCWLDVADNQVLPFVGAAVEVSGTIEGSRPVTDDDATARMRPVMLDLRPAGVAPTLPVIKVKSVRLASPR